MKNFLICFSGIDGSGKSTLCNNVLMKLRDHKVSTRYVYGRFLPAIMAPVFKFISKFMLHKKTSIETSKSYQKDRGQLLKNPFLFNIFIMGVFIDQLFRIFVKIWIPSLFRKDLIICDRYLFDTLILDIGLVCGLNKHQVVKLLQKWIRIFPKSNQNFIVYVPPEVAYQRKKDMHSLEALRVLSDYYLYVGKKFGAIILDGTQTPDQLEQLVITNLKSQGVIDFK